MLGAPGLRVPCVLIGPTEGAVESLTLANSLLGEVPVSHLSSKQQLAAGPGLPVPSELLSYSIECFTSRRAAGDCRLSEQMTAWQLRDQRESCVSLLLSAVKGDGSCQKTTAV